MKPLCLLCGHGQTAHEHFRRGSGHGPGVLWGIQHTAAVGDIPEPWTRITMRPERGGGSESTRGLPPATLVSVGDFIGLTVRAA